MARFLVSSIAGSGCTLLPEKSALSVPLWLKASGNHPEPQKLQQHEKEEWVHSLGFR